MLKDILNFRRAVRYYAPTPISEEKVRECLKLATLAPTGFNMQLYELYHITDKALLEKLAQACLGQLTATTAQQMVVFVTRQDLHRKREKEMYEYFKRSFKIKSMDVSDEIGSLSGGNQQKVVIAKAIASMPKLLILDEPTRGIDAGARGDVYRIIQELKERGLAILMISSDMEEIVQLSDRAVTMYHGRLNAEFVGEDINQANLMSASFGVVKGEKVS